MQPEVAPICFAVDNAGYWTMRRFPDNHQRAYGTHLLVLVAVIGFAGCFSEWATNRPQIPPT
jgi:hypothetical protein